MTILADGRLSMIVIIMVINFICLILEIIAHF